jgi:uncharacterized repeat protein (TIGR01451 family)
MKKILFTVICLVCMSLCPVSAQWENISPTLLKETVSFNNAEVVHYKNMTAAYRQSQGQAYIYYTTNFGVNWRKFKAPTIEASFLKEKQIALNQDGFFLVDNRIVNNKIVVFKTTDFGINWSVDSIQSIVNPLYNPVFGYREGVLNVIENNNTSYKFSNSMWVPSKLLKGILSQNRRIAPVFDDFDRLKVSIYNFTDSLLATINVREAINYNFYYYAQDAIIVALKKGYNSDTINIETSSDLGRTWNIVKVSGRSIINSPILISKSNIFINTSDNIYESKDFGQTWKSIIDDVIGNYAGFVNNRFEVYDSTLVAFNENNLYLKNINDAKWRFANYLSGLPLPVVKVGASTLVGIDDYRKVIYQSKDWGKTWINPQKTPYVYVNQRFFSVGDTIYMANRSVVKSGNFGKTWETSFSYPNFIVVKNDTVVVKSESGELVYSTNQRYTQWNTIVRNRYAPQLYYNDNIPLHIENGLLYSLSASQMVELHRFDGTKIDSFSLTSVPNYLGYSGFLFNKNKIWVYNDSAHTEISLTENIGRTWTKYALPKKISSYAIKTIGNYLIVNTGTKKVNGKLNPSTGGIYISGDNGKTWTFFSEGITLDNTSLDSKLTVIDSFVYINDANSNQWRVSINTIVNQNPKSVSGNVYFDLNKNGRRDSLEMPVFGAIVTSSPSNFLTSTDSLGNYSLLVDLQGTDTLKVSYDNVAGKTTPLLYTITQSDTAKNFGLILPNVDLKINVTAITPPRPGFNNEYLINYKNVGIALANGDVTFVYQTKQSFISSSTPPLSNTNQVITWAYTNLRPNESRSIRVTLKTAVDVVVRSTMTNVVNITSLNIDTFKLDNVDTLIQTVVGSYDPNDKQVTFNNSRTPPSVIDPSTELIYTIRFQNTGNYPADFVKITDTLSDKLDVTTFRLVATSHKCAVSVRNKNVLSFDFNPIYLPDSLRDEKGSRGFVKFAIKPKKTLTRDEVIKNTGYIFFDYNPAIVTNTVETANQKGLGVFTPSVSALKLAIFPNPAENLIKIEVEDTHFKEGTLSIYDLSGRLVLTKFIGDKTGVVNISHLSAGEYICTIQAANNTVFANKFLKL